LLVDDDADIRQAAASHHRSARVTAVIEASNGAEALERLRTLPRPQLVVLRSPDAVMDGWSLLAERNRDPDLRAIPGDRRLGARGRRAARVARARELLCASRSFVEASSRRSSGFAC
jgi:CheY-like chemotaxis protein